jgi:type VI secretion system protein ImpK
MSNKTILISNETNNSNTLTNFNKVDMDPYDNFNKQSSAFRRNNSYSKQNVYEISFNPFLSASSQLFKYVLDISESNDNSFDINIVRDDLISKMNLYDESALKLGINNSEVLVTRYILCTFIDEFMNKSILGTNSNWSSNSLLNIFHKESYGGENFFHLLDKFLKAPAKYIHILELMYICMALGFEGKYRVISRGEIELNNIKDSLFRQIKIVQGRDAYTFYTNQQPSKNKFRLFNKVSYPTLIFGVLILVSMTYAILTLTLNSENNNFLEIIENKNTQLTSIEGKN